MPREEKDEQRLSYMGSSFGLHTSEQPTAQATREEATELKNHLFLKKNMQRCDLFPPLRMDRNNSALSTCDIKYEIIII
jgi:hypothetical protein